MTKKPRNTAASDRTSAPKQTDEERRAAKLAVREANRAAFKKKHEVEIEEQRLAKAAEREKREAELREIRAIRGAEILPPLPPFIEKLSECTDDLLLAILDAVSAGELFSRVCHEYGIKTTKVTAYINRVPEFRTLWDTARRAQAEAWSDKLVELAQSASAEDVHVVRNEIDVRKWIMGKNHIRFSDKATLVLEGNPEKPISHSITDKMSPTEAATEFAEFRKLMSIRGGKP